MGATDQARWSRLRRHRRGREPFTGVKIGTPRDVWVPLVTLRRIDPEHRARFGQRRASWLEMFGRLSPASRSNRRARSSPRSHSASTGHPDTEARAGAGVDPGVGRDVESERAAPVRLRAVRGRRDRAADCLRQCRGPAPARAAARQKEIATRLRSAPDASASSGNCSLRAVLAVAGGIGGLVVGTWLTSVAAQPVARTLSVPLVQSRLRPDWRVFGFTLGVATSPASCSAWCPRCSDPVRISCRR